MEPTAPAAARPCLNCGAHLAGAFCHDCGQRDQPVDLPAREIARGALGDVFAWDGRFWGTVRLLLRRPGFLSAEWAAGRRARYIPPLRLYVIATLLFVGADATYGFAKSALHDDGDVATVEQVEEEENPMKGFVPSNRLERADQYMEGMMGLGLRWFFVVMPLGGFGLYVLYHHRRPSYASHFVVSIHVFVVVILSLAIIEGIKLVWVLVPPHETLNHAVREGSWVLLGCAFLACYLYAVLSVRRFYGLSLPKALVSAPAVTVAPLLGWFGIIMLRLMLAMAWPA